MTRARTLLEVLQDATDWLPAQEVFRRCGVGDGAETEIIEALYSELRQLDKEGRLMVKPTIDTMGRKIQDTLKLQDILKLKGV